jgi:hypothetical protein
LKASCHLWGFDKAALKGILWDSASMNSKWSEVPTGPREIRWWLVLDGNQDFCG